MGTFNSSKPVETLTDKERAVLGALAKYEDKWANSTNALRGFCHDLFWDNKDLTPQQVFDLFGTEAWQVVLDDLAITDFLNSKCKKSDGSVDPDMAPYVITVGVPDSYVLTPNADGVVSAANPYGFGSVTVRPKAYVIAPAGASVSIGDQTETSARIDSLNIEAATFVLPEGSYSGTATLEGYQGGSFAFDLLRGGLQVQSTLIPIPPPPPPPEEETVPGGDGE